MRKLLFVCLLGAHTLQSAEKPIKVKIYRNSFDWILMLLRTAEIGCAGYVGAITAPIIQYCMKHKKINGNLLLGTDRFRLSAALTIGLASHLGVNGIQNWQKKLAKPILIFDAKGFTYEQSKGLFKKRTVIRCLWRDVISHWVTGTVDQYGNQISKYWKYHVKGMGIVSIDVMDLDIPKGMRAKVESLRQGRIRALTEQ